MFSLNKMLVFRRTGVLMAWIMGTLLLFLLGSCSGSDYLNAVPAKSTALISIDMSQMQGGGYEGQAGLLRSLLHVDDVKECGLDLGEKLYLFESQDGNLGLCAAVDDADKVGSWLGQLATHHIATQPEERKGFRFSVLKGSWLVGYSDKALLVMGPVVADAQAEMQRQMVRYLKAGDDEGVKASPLFERLDTVSSPMGMVARAQALPEKFVAPFVLGAPKGTDASQVLVVARMSVADGLLRMEGHTFSLNKQIDEALQKALSVYRPIQGKYVASMPSDAVAGIFMNVDGKQFLPLMQADASLQTLLMGINQAIDMDNIMRSVNGDMAIMIPSFSDSQFKMMMAAQLEHSQWMADIDYWKKSCPPGAKIADWGKNAYLYTDGKASFYFGVTDDRQFYGGSDELSAQYAVKSSNHPMPQTVQQAILGQRLAMVVNLGKGAGGTDAVQAMTGLLSPLFGELSAIVYTMGD